MIITQTYEMVAIADDNNREYESKYGTYSKKDRFKFNEEAKKVVDKSGYRELFNILVHEDLWKLKKEPVKKMTLQDIERELGYRVQIVDPEPDKKKVSEKKRKEVDDSIELFRTLFGIDLDADKYC